MKKSKSKKVSIVLMLSLILLVLLFNSYDIFNGIISVTDGDVLSQLEGNIFYIKRDNNSILNLYSSDANLENQKLIYSNKDSTSENKNIIGFHYDKPEEIINFVCMSLGEWTLHSIDPNGENLKVLENEDESKKVSTIVEEMDSYSIRPVHKDLKAINEKGSMYLFKGNEKILLKKFIGLYDSKFNSGYTPIGFSPDGKYLVFRSTNHLTPIGTLIEGMLTTSSQLVNYYIMDLETKDIDKYLYAYDIEWVETTRTEKGSAQALPK